MSRQPALIFFLLLVLRVQTNAGQDSQILILRDGTNHLDYLRRSDFPFLLRRLDSLS
jgi:hypothetical protein